MPYPQAASSSRRLVRTRPGVVLDDTSIGRIEEWVVRTLEARPGQAAETDWRDSLAGFTLAKRPEAIREGSAPTTNGPWARFRLSKRRGIAVVTLTDQALIREDDLAELAGDLRALVEAGHWRVVLDFANVERLSSWAASTINAAARVCFDAPGGAVKFSGLRPDVAAIFAMTGLNLAVAVAADVASAVAGVWPDLPELRPLPVPILEALMRAEDPRPRRDSRTARGAEDPFAMIGARLIVQDGPSMGRSVPIRCDRFIIGRGPSCQLRLGSSKVSRSHARIERRGRKFFLRDLASTNGSQLNGRPLRDREVEIGDGDVVQFGPITFAVSVGEFSHEIESKRPADDRGWGRSDEGSGSGSTEVFELPAGLGDEAGLKHEVVEGVLVVTPLVPELDESGDVDAFRDGLLALASARLSGRVVVNLTHVGRLSGQAIGVLVAHHLRLGRSGGALRICEASPRVALILEQVKLGMFIDYHPAVEDAVIAAWPQTAATSA